ncbi:unnamed protein product [Rhizophagus irregularis]|nr:unnamed protein product [Rhizophagus irregularis]CAB4433770.1 unnamed protein product [Rhizophagus irregularis]
MNSQNLNSSYDDNTQITSITADGQTNFGNGFSQQTRDRYFANNVINAINPQQVFKDIPQQIPERLRCNGNTTSFCGNIGNNVMTTQVVSIADNQNNGFLQPTNPFSSSISAAPQNRVAYHVTTSGIFFRLKSTWKSTSNTAEICGNLNSSSIFRIPCDETRGIFGISPRNSVWIHVGYWECVEFHVFLSKPTWNYMDRPT